MNAAPAYPRPAKKVSQTPQDFRSLEVRASETSVELIRHAATRQVRRSRELASEVRFFNASAHVASILASAYRLLDPRRRQTLNERVSLSPLLLRDDISLDHYVPRPLLRFDSVSRRRDEPITAVPASANTDPTLNEIRGMVAMIKSVDSAHEVA
jgi:hypothetical protein